MEMSKKIYLLRTESNLTQSEFAKIAGATDKAVSLLSRVSGVRISAGSPRENPRASTVLGFFFAQNLD